MVKIKSDGALTIVRKTRKGGGTRGTLHKDNVAEAVARGSGNTIMMDQKANTGKVKSKR